MVEGVLMDVAHLNAIAYIDQYLGRTTTNQGALCSIDQLNVTSFVMLPILYMLG